MTSKKQRKSSRPSVKEVIEIMEAMADYFGIQGDSIIKISDFQDKYEKELSKFQEVDPGELIDNIKKKDSKIAEQLVHFYLEYAQLLNLQTKAKTHKDRKKVGEKLVKLGKILNEIILEFKVEVTTKKKKQEVS